MTLFETIRITLDQLYQQGVDEYGSAAAFDGEVKKRMSYLSKSYGNLDNSDRMPIDYGNPASRFAYVYSYVAAHSDYIVQALELLQTELGTNIFQKTSLQASCIGGGPGSDILAILKYLGEQQAEPVEQLTCYLVDREQAWADTWTEVDQHLAKDLSLTTIVQPLDVTRPETWKYQKKFLAADLFTLSYFVSEVYSLDNNGDVTKFLTDLLKQAKPGALVLYIDNDHATFSGYFDQIWQKAKIEPLLEKSDVWTPHFSEQTSEIQDYIDKFDRSPKLKSRLTLRVLRKIDK